MSNLRNTDEQEITFTMKGLLLYSILTQDDTDQNIEIVNSFLYGICERMASKGYKTPPIIIRYEMHKLSGLAANHVALWVDKAFTYINDDDVYSEWEKLGKGDE